MADAGSAYQRAHPAAASADERAHHGRESRIEDHGVIGDMRTVALVDTQGTIDFLCWPHFDSPSVFAGLLDAERGGSFSITPRLGEDARKTQLYLPDTNVLISRTLAPNGLTEISDLMVLDGGPQRLVRTVKSLREEVEFDLRCAPRFDYARADHSVELEGKRCGVFYPETGTALRLVASVPLEADGRDVVARFRLGAGATAVFVLEAALETQPVEEDLGEFSDHCFRHTVQYWHDWVGRSTYHGRWQEVVQRSALVLKLLTFKKTGALVASPTFGLPEVEGASRNWDYRYTWIRDAGFTLYALIRLGHVEEAHAFIDWLGKCDRAASTDGPLQVMYRIDGSQCIDEKELPHLSGYHDSKPVRIGNAAHSQLQLDIYGSLIDAIYLASKYGAPISYDAWEEVTLMCDWVCDNWHRPDEGIWEMRGGRKEFLHSRLMCWVALDRALRLANKRSLPANFERWQLVRDEIYRNIHTEFWDEERNAFVQFKGGKSLDASCLLMPMVRFISPKDPRWLSTLEAIEDELADDALVHRYDPEKIPEVDALDGNEGSFTMCSFWYVECLTRAGQIDRARLLFEKMISYSNHLGLYAEELGRSGEHLGNFPQALTHLALISAAVALDRALSGRSQGSWR